MIQEMFNKAVNRCIFVFDYIPDRHKTQKRCDRVVSEDPLFIVYCPDRCITQKMCDEAADDSLATLKLISDWFVTSKTIQKLFTALNVDENILYFNEDFGHVVFKCNGMGILDIELDNINYDNNFDEDDPDTIILIRLLPWYIKFGKCKELKK